MKSLELAESGVGEEMAGGVEERLVEGGVLVLAGSGGVCEQVGSGVGQGLVGGDSGGVEVMPEGRDVSWCEKRAWEDDVAQIVGAVEEMKVMQKKMAADLWKAKM